MLCVTYESDEGESRFEAARRDVEETERVLYGGTRNCTVARQDGPSQRFIDVSNDEYLTKRKCIQRITYVATPLVLRQVNRNYGEQLSEG